MDYGDGEALVRIGRPELETRPPFRTLRYLTFPLRVE